MLALGTKPEYLESPWVRSEWKRYLEMIDAGEEKLLIPMYRDLDPAKELPAEFRMRYLQSLDMRDPGLMYDLEDLLKKAVPSRRVQTPEPEPESEPDPVQNRLINAMFRLEDRDFEEDAKALNAILVTNPKCAGAHLGLCIADLRVKREEELPNVDTQLNQNNSFLRALRFANAADKTRWQGYSDAQETHFAREAEEKRQAEEAERQRIEAERQRREAQEAERRRREAEEAERKRHEAEEAERQRRQAEEAERQRIEAERQRSAAEKP